MSYGNICYEKKDRIATICISHPPANAWDLKTTTEMAEVINDVETDKEVRAVIITGEGEKFFSAGLDIKDAKNKLAIRAAARAAWLKIERFEKPVIAAINGTAVGGALELILGCHFRLMEKNTSGRLGLVELNIGIIPAWGGTQRLKRLVGTAKALDLILFHKLIAAEKAAELGIVTHLVERGTLMATARQLAEELAKKPLLAVKWTLRAMVAGDCGGPDAGYLAESMGIREIDESEDCREGFRAFVEKRKPEFKVD